MMKAASEYHLAKYAHFLALHSGSISEKNLHHLKTALPLYRHFLGGFLLPLLNAPPHQTRFLGTVCLGYV